MHQLPLWILLIQVAATLAMVGLIWFVQVVHYPLFSRVGPEEFRRYEMEHQRLTSYVVAPLMLAEMTTAIMLCRWRPDPIAGIAVWFGLLVLIGIWWMTYTVQVPQHASLVFSYNSTLQQQLVSGNWYRTAAWSARGMLVLWMVSELVTTANLAAPGPNSVGSLMP